MRHPAAALIATGPPAGGSVVFAGTTVRRGRVFAGIGCLAWAVAASAVVVAAEDAEDAEAAAAGARVTVISSISDGLFDEDYSAVLEKDAGFGFDANGARGVQLLKEVQTSPLTSRILGGHETAVGGGK